MEKQQKETEKQIITEKELRNILLSKTTIMFANDLSKFNDNLQKLRKVSPVPVDILDESFKNIAEGWINSTSPSPYLFITDFNIYYHNLSFNYDVNIIEGEYEQLISKLEAILETKIEILPKK